MMRKIIRCKGCGKQFSVNGEGNPRTIKTDMVTCPHCEHPNEVDWPLEMPKTIEKL
ncbi:MAG: hypothetical protein WB780_08020 [Candidatus Acidiferrales bacterium]